MILTAAITHLKGIDLAVVLVESRYTTALEGAKLLLQLSTNFPVLPVMLVSIENNGFRAYAAFQTSTLLALLQMSTLTFEEFTVGISNAEELPPF